jgi:hypothetical protein
MRVPSPPHTSRCGRSLQCTRAHARAAVRCSAGQACGGPCWRARPPGAACARRRADGNMSQRLPPQLPRSSPQEPLVPDRAHGLESEVGVVAHQPAVGVVCRVPAGRGGTQHEPWWGLGPAPLRPASMSWHPSALLALVHALRLCTSCGVACDSSLVRPPSSLMARISALRQPLASPCAKAAPPSRRPMPKVPPLRRSLRSPCSLGGKCMRGVEQGGRGGWVSCRPCCCPAGPSGGVVPLAQPLHTQTSVGADMAAWSLLSEHFAPAGQYLHGVDVHNAEWGRHEAIHNGQHLALLAPCTRGRHQRAQQVIWGGGGGVQRRARACRPLRKAHTQRRRRQQRAQAPGASERTLATRNAVEGPQSGELHAQPARCCRCLHILQGGGLAGGSPGPAAGARGARSRGSCVAGGGAGLVVWRRITAVLRCERAAPRGAVTAAAALRPTWREALAAPLRARLRAARSGSGRPTLCRLRRPAGQPHCPGARGVQAGTSWGREQRVRAWASAGLVSWPSTNKTNQVADPPL